MHKLILMVLENLLTDPALILSRDFFIPFIVVFILFWATLSAVKAFNSRINIVLAVALTIMTALSPAFTIVAEFLLLIGPLTSIGLIFGLFIIAAVWAVRRGKDVYHEGAHKYKKIERINKEIAKLENKIDRTRDEAKIRAYAETIERLERQRRIEEARH